MSGPGDGPLNSPFDKGHVRSASYPSGSVPSDPVPVQELWDSFYENLDLNVSEAVMAYSGILQAVPLLGGLFKANQVLNRIGRWATKALRKRPFTEVVRSAISADFINRFVVQTTVNDLRKVQDSTDYVLRVLQTARERNSALTPVQTEVNTSTVLKSGEQVIRHRYPPNPGDGAITISTKWDVSNVLTDKLCVLANVKYDVDAVSPIQLWANRVGLTRPLESAWDLVPFSFVVDYFTRAGDFISHLSDEMSSIDGLKGKVLSMYGAWICSKRTLALREQGLSASFSMNRYRWGDNPQKIFIPGTCTVSLSTFHRFPASSVGESGFWDRGGLISPRLSSTRLRTLAELFIQAKTR